MLFSTTLTTSILLFVGENDVITESVHHFHEGIVHDSTILLENSVDVPVSYTHLDVYKRQVINSTELL